MAKIVWEGVESFAFYLIDIEYYKNLDEYKNKMPANVSHNLRTPLTTVSGNLEIVYKQEERKENRSLLKVGKSRSFSFIA